MINKALSSIDTLSSIEKRKILVQYRKLQDTFVGHINKQEQAKVDEAFVLLLSYHTNTGCNSIRAIIHSLRVAQIVSKEIGLGATSILSSLLHGVIGDTGAFNDISEKFGPGTSKLVQNLAEIKNIFEWNSSEHVEDFKKLVSNLMKDSRIILIKIADKLDHMRSLSSLPRHKQPRVANEIKQIYVPLAHRIGLDNIKTELEDLHFRYMYPDVYKDLAKKINSRWENSKDIDTFIEPIKQLLKRQGIKFRIKKRRKKVYSTWKKMRKRKISLTQIYDIVGLRIILSSSREEEKMVCWETYGIITELYKSKPKRLRDWISKPKPNGYESLHTTAMSKGGEWIEIQIRTERMDKIATIGVASHWKYKDDSVRFNMQALELWINNTKSFLCNIQDKGGCTNYIKCIGTQLYRKEISVFTKYGAQKTLPKGASLLDLAIECMGQEGLKCSSAWISSSIIPLQHLLKDGDLVDFIIDKKQVPKQEWLSFVITLKAREMLSSVLKRPQKK